MADNILLDWPPDKRIYNPPIQIYYQLVQGISIVCRWYVAHTRGPAPASRWQKCPQNAEFWGYEPAARSNLFSSIRVNVVPSFIDGEGQWNWCIQVREELVDHLGTANTGHILGSEAEAAMTRPRPIQPPSYGLPYLERPRRGRMPTWEGCQGRENWHPCIHAKKREKSKP